MADAHPEQNGSLLENYCSRLGVLLDRRYSGLALLEAKQQAEKAAVVAHEAMLKAKAADRAKSTFLANMAHELRNAAQCDYRLFRDHQARQYSGKRALSGIRRRYT